jgi:hypothetical protein
MTSSGVRDAEPTVARSASADLNVLLLAANPLTTSRLDLEAETSAVERELNRDRVKFECRYAVSPDEMIRHVRRQNPSVLHFSGHGTRGGVVMRIDGSEALEVPGDALARFVQDRGISLVVLNCCCRMLPQYASRRCSTEHSATASRFAKLSATEEMPSGCIG